MSFGICLLFLFFSGVGYFDGRGAIALICATCLTAVVLILEALEEWVDRK